MTSERKGYPVGGVARQARRRGGRHEVERILERRGQLVEELARLRCPDHRSSFVDSAQQLLTRQWASASWSAREQLLDATDWLIRLERNRRELSPSAA